MTEYTGGILSRVGVITSAPASGYHWAGRVERRRRPPFIGHCRQPILLWSLASLLVWPWDPGQVSKCPTWSLVLPSVKWNCSASCRTVRRLHEILGGKLSSLAYGRYASTFSVSSGMVSYLDLRSDF